MTDGVDPAPNQPETGKMPAVASGASAIDPFEATQAPRNWRTRLLDYSAHAAMIVGLLGFVWTVGDHVVHRSSEPTDAPAKSVASAPADAGTSLADLRKRNTVLAEDVRTLQARLDALQASVGDQNKVAAQVHALQAGLDSVKTNLGAARSEQAAVTARLDSKIEKIGHEPGSKMQQLVDRLGKLERSGVDVAPTASLPHGDGKPADRATDGDAKSPAVRSASRSLSPKSDAKIAEAKPAANDDKAGAKPQVIANWVVRDVYQGVALIEGRRGTLEVVPGVSIPGAGVVKSIDRRGGGWTVTTTKGVVAYAAPPRDYRRADRDGYYANNGYRYDF